MWDLKRNSVAVVFGILGMLFAYIAIHLYQDHNSFHALLNALVQRQAQQSQQK